MDLQNNKITQIKFKKVRNRYPRLYGKNARLPEHTYGVEFVIVEITTDKNIKGWGLCKGNYKEFDYDYIKDKRVSELFNPVIGVVDDKAMLLDFALHDLAGKILGIPVYKMIGDLGSNEGPCYDGAIYMNDISAGDGKIKGIDRILNDCQQDYDMGYRDFKIKIGRSGMWMDKTEGLSRDIEVTRAIREKYPDSQITVDANDAYSIEDCEHYMSQVGDCNIYWFEEPFRESKEGFKRLKDILAKYSPNTLIADGESWPDVPFLLELMKDGLLDVLQMDICDYGFTNWRKLMPVIRENEYMISPHNWGLKLKTHYTAQFAAGCGSVLTNEGVPDETEGVDFSGYELKDGIIYVPNKPGFGMDLIWGQDI